MVISYLFKNKLNKLYKKTVLVFSIQAFIIAGLTPLHINAQPMGLPSMGPASSAELSPILEQALGDAIMEQGLRDPDYISDPDVNQYLTEMGQKLVRHASVYSGQKISVFALRDRQINAFALPGGYIGINSGLFASSESESELASVVAHEVAHVLQRHIARGMTQSAKSSHIMIAALAGALLAAVAGSGDLATGVAAFGQAAAIDQQLGFSRQAEQEADRIGMEMMRKAGYDPRGMYLMFSRLSNASKLNEGMGGNVYTRTHPLSVQRMSDIENRLGSVKTNPTVNASYWYLRAKVLVMQSKGSRAITNALDQFRKQIANSSGHEQAAAHYGLAYMSWVQKKYDAASKHLEQGLALGVASSQMLELKTLLQIQNGQMNTAVQTIQQALSKWPNSQSIALAYALVLQKAGQHGDAVSFLSNSIKKWPDLPALYQQRARNYEAQGQQVSARRSMANYYELIGAVPTAVEQLQQARSLSKDFYEQSELDAQIRSLKQRMLDDRDLLKRFES